MEKFELLELCIEFNYVFIMQIHRYSQVGQVAKRTQADQGKYFTYWAKRYYALRFTICFMML
jgi:hypothetical protein